MDTNDFAELMNTPVPERAWPEHVTAAIANYIPGDRHLTPTILLHDRTYAEVLTKKGIAYHETEIVKYDLSLLVYEHPESGDRRFAYCHHRPGYEASYEYVYVFTAPIREPYWHDIIKSLTVIVNALGARLGVDPSRVNTDSIPWPASDYVPTFPIHTEMEMGMTRGLVDAMIRDRYRDKHHVRDEHDNEIATVCFDTRDIHFEGGRAYLPFSLVDLHDDLDLPRIRERGEAVVLLKGSGDPFTMWTELQMPEDYGNRSDGWYLKRPARYWEEVED